MKPGALFFPSSEDTEGMPDGTAVVIQGLVGTTRQALTNGISFTDNIDCEVNSATFSHGVPQSVKLRRLNTANGIIGLSADGQYVAGLPSVTGGSAGQVMITYNFVDPTATGVVCSFVLLRDGLPGRQASDLKWIAPTLINAWANTGAGNLSAGYLKDALGFVRLRGEIKTGAIPSIAFQLPAGYRPTGSHTQVTVCAGPTLGYIVVDTSGNVSVQAGNNAAVELGGIQFDTRA